MPHLTLDYSGNLRETGRFDVLCASLARTLVAFEADGQRVYPVGGVRVRALRADHWAIGDGRTDAAFVHARLHVGAGRSAATLTATGDALFAAMKAHFADLFERQGLGTVAGGRGVQRSRHLEAQQPARADAHRPDEGHPHAHGRRALARMLYDARRTRTPLRHFSQAYPHMTIDDGYAIQREWVKLELADGHTIKGRKIGLTSRAMQISSQIDEPDFAPLMDDMFFAAGGDIPIARFIAPRVEVELAFILGARLAGPGVTRDDVLAATQYVAPAVEIIDARIEQFDRDTKAPRKVFDTIADFAANAGIVLSEHRARPADLDLRWVGALLEKNGVIEETGLAAGVLGHPANGVAWLANRIAPYGEALAPGDVVLAGSFTRPTPAAAGDVFRVDYGPLGIVAFRFV